jgi:hypothetical protein
MITRPLFFRNPASWRWIGVSIAAVTTLSLAACSGGSAGGAPTITPSSSPDLPSASASVPVTPSTPAASSSRAPEAGAGVVGTVVRFSRGSTAVEVTIGEDNPAVRDFISMLPLTLTLEEFAGREKIAYLPRELAHEGSPGSEPENGDLIYYIPWGNLGFYYNTEGIGFSDQAIHLGTYEASLEELGQLEGPDVTVEVIEP